MGVAKKKIPFGNLQTHINMLTNHEKCAFQKPILEGIIDQHIQLLYSKIHHFLKLRLDSQRFLTANDWVWQVH